MRIVYGVAGEGLGHATRAHAMIEELGDDCHFDIYTFGEAHKYFAKVIRDGARNIYLHELIGLRFARGRDNKISTLGSIRDYWEYKKRYWDLDRHRVYWDILNAEPRPDVVITDFEPAVAARLEDGEVEPAAAGERGQPTQVLPLQHRRIAVQTPGLLQPDRLVHRSAHRQDRRLRGFHLLP